MKDRQFYIGGTDAPVIMGLKPFGKTIHQLWEEKITGHSIVKENDAMRKGKELEGKCLNHFLDDLPCYSLLEKNCFYEKDIGSKKYRLGANIDAICEYINPFGYKLGYKSKFVLEIKTTSNLKYLKECPKEYMYQLLHYLLVTGISYGEIAIFYIEKEGNSIKNFKKYRIFHHDFKDEMQELEQKELEFIKYLEEREIPPAEPKTHKEIQIDNADIYSGYLEYLSAKEEEELARIKVDTIKNSILNKCSENGIYYDKTTGEKLFIINEIKRNNFDIRKFHNENPNFNLEKYQSENTYKTFRAFKQ